MLLSWSVLVFALTAATVSQDVDPTPDRHLTISESEAEGKRIFVVGDVHGCYDEMIELFREADIIDTDNNLKNDVILIFAGDIVNKGPKNIEIMRWTVDNSAYNVYGNHELNVISNPRKYSWTRDMTDADFDYLRALPYTVSIPSYGVIVVHAGVIPDRDLNSQTEFIMTRMRNIQRRNGRLVPHERSSDPGRNWAKLLTGPYRVIYGHDAGRGRDSSGNPRVQYHPYATGLDSRCVYGGKLSGVFLSRDGGTDVIHQVPCEEYDTRKQDDLQQDE